MDGCGIYLEPNVVTDEDVALHELLLILPVLGHHWEGVVDRGPQDADQGLDASVWVHVGQVGLHDVTGRQPETKGGTQPFLWEGGWVRHKCSFSLDHSLVHLHLCLPLQKRNAFQLNVDVIYALVEEIPGPLCHLKVVSCNNLNIWIIVKQELSSHTIPTKFC